jgi:Family of unknown function (DUF6157)
MNYYDTLIEVADDCPATGGQIPKTRGGRKTKAVVEYELLVKHPYRYTAEDIALEVYAVRHDIPKARWPTEREKPRRARRDVPGAARRAAGDNREAALPAE